MNIPSVQDLQNLKILAEHNVKTRVNFETGNLEVLDCYIPGVTTYYDPVSGQVSEKWIEVQGWSLEKHSINKNKTRRCAGFLYP